MTANRRLFGATVTVVAMIPAWRATFALSRAQESSLPPSVSLNLPKEAIVRALARLGKSEPERWFVAYDQRGQGRVALFEGNMMTDDKAFESDRNFGQKLSVENLQSLSVPKAESSFLLSLAGSGSAKYFGVVTFSSGALDIKLFVSTIGGRAEVMDNPFRVRIWSKVRASGPGPDKYKIAEFRLPNEDATKLVKVQEEIKARQ